MIARTAGVVFQTQQQLAPCVPPRSCGPVERSNTPYNLEVVLMGSQRCMRTNWQPEGMSANQLMERGCSTLEEYIAALDVRRQKRDALHQFVSRTDISGQEKGWVRCEYIHKNLRLPFQCRTCWLLPGNCICSRLRRYDITTKVVIHLHPDEWAKGSNTGCLCSSLSNCELLMKGHKQHDQRVQQLLNDTDYTCAILWPGEGALECHELQQLAQQRSNGRIALIALDATWDGARKMRSKYSPSVHMLKLPPHLALPSRSQQQQQQQQEEQQQALQVALPLPESMDHHHDRQQQQSRLPRREAGQQQQPSQEHQHQQSSQGSVATKTQATGSSGKASHSLFRPLRKYHGDLAETGRVCTIEAVAAALLALEGNSEMYEGLLYNLKLKVDAMRRQKHVGEVYGILSSAEEL